MPTWRKGAFFTRGRKKGSDFEVLGRLIPVRDFSTFAEGASEPFDSQSR